VGKPPEAARQPACRSAPRLAGRAGHWRMRTPADADETR
jgi:hypothetical protein